MTQKRPQQDEYALYYGKYIELVPSGDFLEILQDQRRDLNALLSPLTEDQAEFRYAPGKWSIKEVLGHVTDAEARRVGVVAADDGGAREAAHESQRRDEDAVAQRDSDRGCGERRGRNACGAATDHQHIGLGQQRHAPRGLVDAW